MGIVAIAALVYVAWWMIWPVPFTTVVTEEHIAGIESGYFLKLGFVAVKTRRGMDSQYKVFLSSSGDNETIRVLAKETEAQMLADPDITTEVVVSEFSNVILVCTRIEYCDSMKRQIISETQRLGITSSRERPFVPRLFDR